MVSHRLDLAFAVMSFGSRWQYSASLLHALVQSIPVQFGLLSSLDIWDGPSKLIKSLHSEVIHIWLLPQKVRIQEISVAKIISWRLNQTIREHLFSYHYRRVFREQIISNQAILLYPQAILCWQNIWKWYYSCPSKGQMQWLYLLNC